jgi:mono/diheme cytochrome c family protein/cytochrome c553
MIRHFKLWVILLGFGLAALLIVFAGSLYTGSCSYLKCTDGGRARAVHTPIPTLMPVQVNFVAFPSSSSSENCSVTAKTLLSAWISAGFPEDKPFFFTDLNNVSCEATFADVQVLFAQSNLWHPGALACTACHNADLSAAASAQLDLSSYAGAVAKSYRAPGSTISIDILGAGDWQQSVLNQVLFVQPSMPYGLPSGTVTGDGPSILVGIPITVANPITPTEPAAPEVARPSNPGDAGDAVNLTGDPVAGEKVFLANCQLCHGTLGKDDVANPGTGDTTVPALNPIDETLKDPDAHTYAYNLDLFIQNGSTPGGPSPSRLMPAFGAKNGLTQQQIADVIAYIISLNK